MTNNIFNLLRNKWLWVSITVAALIALFFLDPTGYALMPKCPFKLLTGFDCPGCGFQRAAHALLHGHLVEAWRYNRFLIYAVPWLLCVIYTEWIAHGERQMRFRSVFEGRIAVSLYVVLFVAWGIVRNIWGM